MTLPSVSVVVATRDRAQRLARLLDRLDEQTLRPAEVVVVDDGSRDATAALLAERSAAAGGRLVVVRQPRSAGPAAARNAGAARATGDLLAFTDDDCQPQPDWLLRLAEQAAGGADVVLGSTVADPAAWESRGTWSHAMVTEGFDVMYSTCNIAYRSALFRRLGGFDEGFGGSRGGAQWGEDTDLGWRAAETGAQVVHEPDAVVEHDVVPRGWAAYCLAGLRRQGIPRLVRKHPGYRTHLWARVFLNAAHAWAPLGALGLVAGGLLLPTSPALAALVVVVCFLPYLNFRLRVWPLPARRRYLPLVLPRLWLADLLETLLVVLAAGANRVLVI